MLALCIATVALATILVMVLKVLSSEPQSPLEKKCEGQQQQERRDVGKSEQDDGSSVGTSSSSSDEESEDEKNNGALVLASENAENGGPKYGNISVANSSEVHFGNKTFYQGPVTIKQFVYANGALESGENSLEQIKDKVLEVPASVSNPAEKSASSVKSAISARNYSTLAKGLQWIRNHRVAFSLLTAVVVLSLLTLTIVLVSRKYLNQTDRPNNNVQDSSELEQADLTQPHIDPNRTVTLSGVLKIVQRREWLAQPPVEEINNLAVPVPFVIIMHTASDNCTNQGDCTHAVRYIQSFHIDSQKWWDIGYNFLVGGDGYVYEGRGWKKEGSHTLGYNIKSIGIAFIGTFNKYLPSPDQMRAGKMLIEKGVQLGYIQKNYTLFGATQLSQTQSPGQRLFEDMKSWPHFGIKPQIT